jgi:hypothetical protein
LPNIVLHCFALSYNIIHYNFQLNCYIDPRGASCRKMFIELTEEQQKPEPLPPPPPPVPVIPDIPIQIPSGRTASLDDSSDEMSGADKRHWDRTASSNDVSASWDRASTANDSSNNWDRTSSMTGNDVSASWDRASTANDVSSDPRHAGRRRDSSNGGRRSEYSSRSEKDNFSLSFIFLN